VNPFERAYEKPEAGNAVTIQSVEKRLDGILDAAIERAYNDHRGIKGAALAREIYGSEPELMEELKESWMVERLAWHINRKRTERWRENSSQLVLPGFEEMPLRIFLRNGERPRLDYATMSQIEDHVKLLRTRFTNSPRLKRMEAVLDLMRRYAAQKENFGITWSDVKKKELERRDFERLVGGE
jgi:hypothetical protein